MLVRIVQLVVRATCRADCALLCFADETNDCAQACAHWQACLSTQCAARYQSIDWLTPTEGAVVKGGSAVQVHLTENPGRRRKDPPELELVVGGLSATLQLVEPGTYQSPIPALADGPYGLVARLE
jgi:hypothetical protein